VKTKITTTKAKPKKADAWAKQQIVAKTVNTKLIQAE